MHPSTKKLLTVLQERIKKNPGDERAVKQAARIRESYEYREYEIADKISYIREVVGKVKDLVDTTTLDFETRTAREYADAFYGEIYDNLQACEAELCSLTEWIIPEMRAKLQLDNRLYCRSCGIAIFDEQDNDIELCRRCDKENYEANQI